MVPAKWTEDVQLTGGPSKMEITSLRECTAPNQRLTASGSLDTKLGAAKDVCELAPAPVCLQMGPALAFISLFNVICSLAIICLSLGYVSWQKQGAIYIGTVTQGNAWAAGLERQVGVLGMAGRIVPRAVQSSGWDKITWYSSPWYRGWATLGLWWNPNLLLQ